MVIKPPGDFNIRIFRFNFKKTSRLACFVEIIKNFFSICYSYTFHGFSINYIGEPILRNLTPSIYGNLYFIHKYIKTH